MVVRSAGSELLLLLMRLDANRARAGPSILSPRSPGLRRPETAGRPTGARAGLRFSRPGTAPVSLPSGFGVGEEAAR